MITAVRTAKKFMSKNVAEQLKNIGKTVLLLAGATILGWIFYCLKMNDSNIVIVYLMAVLLTARLTKGYFYGLSASVLSFLLYNWFFTEPLYSLKINDPSNIITVVIMTVTATITSALTSKVKQSAAEAREKEEESNALYQMTNHLTDAENCDAIAEITVRTVSQLFSCNVSCITFDEKGIPMPTFIQQKLDGAQIHRELEQPEELKKRVEGLHAGADIGKEFYDFPIYGRNSILALLRIPRETAENLSPMQIRLVHSLGESAALAMERIRSLQAQAKSREETIQERYRGNLLRAISHDLRTPLAGIMGTSEMLMGMTEKEDPRYEMAKDIYKDADWLHGLVENILSLTKFQDGRLSLNKEPEAVEEVIGAALAVIEKRMPDRKIEISIPDNLLLVPMDARLITQVLVNLLDNAAKHTPEENEIAVSVEELSQTHEAQFCVADRGTGIAANDLPNIFQMFYTTNNKGVDSKRGVGLGLTICQSIIEAHGGKIHAENRPDGGAKFMFTLPLGGDKE